jgi:DNA replication protein DnaT
MNSVEENHLKKRTLSHMARSLYVLFLRDLGVRQINTIDLVAITDYLYTASYDFPTKPNYQIAELCLNELEKEGLIKRNGEDYWHGATFNLPYLDRDINIPPTKPFIMHKGWEPVSAFKEVALQCGLEDATFETQQLKDFVSYWMSKPESRSQLGWERAFARRLLTLKEKKIPKKSEQPNSQDLPPKENVHPVLKTKGTEKNESDSKAKSYAEQIKDAAFLEELFK